MSRVKSFAFAATVMLGLAAGGASAPGADWPQYGFNGAHSSFNDAESTLSRANVSRLTFAWAVFVGSTWPDKPSAPIVAGGILYAAAAGHVFAFDAATGASQFSRLTCDGLGSVQPAFLDNHELVVGDPGGELAAYRPTTGAQRWCDDVGGSISSAVSVSSSTAYDTNGSDLQATSQSGAVVWKFTPPDFLPLTNTPAVSHGTVYVTGGDTIFAVRASDGTLLWRRTLKGEFDENFLSAPSVNALGTTVYVGGTCLGLFALNAETGATKWRGVVGAGESTPAVANGKVYVNSEDPVFGLFAFNATTGALLWRSEDPGEPISTPTVANGVVYDLSDTGDLMMFDSSTGALLGTLADPGGRPFGGLGDPVSQAAVVNGMVYVSTRTYPGSGDASNQIDAFRLP